MKPPCHLPRFLRDLDAGANIVLLVAPAAAALLPELPGALAALAQRGLRAAFPVLPYADIATWVYYRFLREGERGIVCSACAGMNRALRRRSPAAGRRSVYSPLLCAARYLKTYCGIDAAFAFLSPCCQKCREFSVAGEELVHYNLTIDAFAAEFAEATATAAPAETAAPATPAAPAVSGLENGLTAAAFGSISGALGCLLPDIRCTVAEGRRQASALLAAARATQSAPDFFEPYACSGGCANGTGLQKTLKTRRHRQEAAGHFLMQTEVRPSPAAILARFAGFDRELALTDFYSEVP